VTDWRSVFWSNWCIAYTQLLHVHHRTTVTGCFTYLPRWALIRTGSDWIRTEANFGWNRTGSDNYFFEIWGTRTGSDWEFFCCFNVIILKISKIWLWFDFTGLLNDSVICHRMQKLCWDYFAIWTVTTFVHI